MSASGRWTPLTVALVLLSVMLPAGRAQAAEDAVTTMSAIVDNGRSDKSVATAVYWRGGPDRVTVTGSLTDQLTIQAYRGTTGYGEPGSISIAPPLGKSLEAGTYTDASDEYPTADRARFRGSPSQCQFQQARTTFTIAELAPDLSQFLLQYRTRCLGGEAGTFGEVRINQPAPAGLVFGATRVSWPERLVALSRSEVPLALWNPGSEAVSLTGAALSGPDAGQFLTQPLGACAQIAPGGLCMLTVGFRPTRGGDAHATVTLSGPEGSHVLPLAGSAVMNPTTVSIAGDWQNRIIYHPGNYWEGRDNLRVTQAYGQVSVSVRPAGATQSEAIGLSFRPPPGEQLHVGHYVTSGALTGSDGPVMAISDYGGGGACSTQAGDFDVLDLAPDRVWITFRATCSQGEGPSVFGEIRSGLSTVGDVVTVPTRLTWSAQQLGETNDPVSVSLVNLGEQQLSVSDVRTTGGNAADFTAAPVGTCAVIASAAGCHLKVTFQPAELGPRSTTLSVSDSRGGRTIDLTGSGRPGPQLSTVPRPEHNHFPTCNVVMGATGPDSVSFSWGDECDPHQGATFYDYRAHYLIRGAVGTVPPQVEADGFHVYSGHGRSASIVALQRGQTYSFTLFTQHNGGGVVTTSRTIAPVRISINANLTSPVPGADLLVTGRVTSPAGSALGAQPVELRALYPGTSTPVTVATGQTDYVGDYALKFVPTRAASYVVHYTATGGSDFPSQSASRSVPLTVRLGLQAPTKAVTYGKLVTIKASITPAQPNSSGKFQVYRGGKWKNLGSARCDATGVLRFKVKLTDRGIFKYRVWWPGNAVTVAGYSKTVKIRVK